MNLTEKAITISSDDYKEIDAFMKRVFPKEELIPTWLITILAKKKNHEFSAFYDENLFVGISYTIESETSLFLFYLAINDKIHSKGYGSKLLNSLFDKYKDKPITLFIETLDQTAPNYEQRVKRLSFYERNNFINTNIKAGVDRPFVDILSTDNNFTVDKCKKMLKFIPLKIYTSDTLTR